MKTIFVADVHFDVSGRNKDVLWGLEIVRDYAFKYDISNIFILGDLFHSRQSLAIDSLCLLYDFFSTCKERGQEWAVFPGNHDMFLKHSWDINSLKPFADRLRVIDGVKLLVMGDRRFWVVPFIYSEPAYMEIIRRIELQHEPDDVLLTHIGVTDAELNRCFLLQHWSVVSFVDSKFDQVFTGHFHVHQKVGSNVVYPGSLIPFKFDEGDSPHGFIVYDTADRSYEFQNLWTLAPELAPGKPMPPEFFTILDTDIDSRVEHISGNNIRVMLSHEYDQHQITNLRTRLTELGANKISILKLKESIEPHQAKLTAPQSADQLFLNWIANDDVEKQGLNRKLLTRLDMEVRKDGDEVYMRDSSLVVCT